MASNARNFNHGVAFPSLRPLRDRFMRAGYVLISEEQESGSEYSGSTCCCCSSCASSCSCEEHSDDDDSEEEDDDESDGVDIAIEEAEVVEEEEEGYWSDCSACWARRRDRERRGTGGRFGNRYMNVARAAEGRDSLQVHLHHHHHQRVQQHRGRNETLQRGRRNANRVTFRSTNSIITGAAAETPSFRGLVDRIVSTTRHLRQGEQNVRHLRSWARVLEDLQIRANAAAASNTAANPTVAARGGRQSPSSGTAVRRAANVSAEDGNRAREAQAQNQARPRRATGRNFMSGGRSTSIIGEGG